MKGGSVSFRYFTSTSIGSDLGTANYHVNLRLLIIIVNLDSTHFSSPVHRCHPVHRVFRDRRNPVHRAIQHASVKRWARAWGAVDNVHGSVESQIKLSQPIQPGQLMVSKPVQPGAPRVPTRYSVERRLVPGRAVDHVGRPVEPKLIMQPCMIREPCIKFIEWEKGASVLSPRDPEQESINIPGIVYATHSGGKKKNETYPQRNCSQHKLRSWYERIRHEGVYGITKSRLPCVVLALIPNVDLNLVMKLCTNSQTRYHFFSKG